MSGRARARTPFLLTFAAVLACAGCIDTGTGTSSSAEEAEPDVVPAAGPEITGDGYTYRVPEGWGVPPEEAPGAAAADTLVLDLDDRDGFSDNVNVSLGSQAEPSPEEAEQAASSELEATGAQDVTIEDRATVAGDEVAHVTARFSLNDNEYTVEQFYPVNDNQIYVVTFSFSTDVTPAERAEVTGPVLATFAWSD